MWGGFTGAWPCCELFFLKITDYIQPASLMSALTTSLYCNIDIPPAAGSQYEQTGQCSAHTPLPILLLSILNTSCVPSDLSPHPQAAHAWQRREVGLLLYRRRVILWLHLFHTMSCAVRIICACRRRHEDCHSTDGFCQNLPAPRA